jgi:N-acetylneuraminic acid mutarotase
MEKPTWKKIESTNSKPCPRWGHASCVVGDEVLFFGGYAGNSFLIQTPIT